MPTKPSSDPNQNAPSTPSIRSMIFLVGGAGAIGVFLALAISLIQVARVIQWRPILLGLDGMRLPLMIVGTSLVSLIVFLIWLRPRWKTVGLVLGALILVGVTGRLMFRIESFYGNLIPRLTWRWEPTAEEQFAQWQENRERVTATTSVTPTPESFPAVSNSDFPGFLGAQRDGVVQHVQLDPNWAARSPRQLWRRPIGLGWSGFAVVGHLAVTQEQRGSQETVVGYDLMTGVERWVHADEVRFTDEHGDGPRATPTIAQGRIYTMGGTGLLNCLDALSGELIWQQATLPDPETQNLLWGMSGSPLLVDDCVIVTPGAGPGKSTMAFDRRDGHLIWSAGDDPAAYASPALGSLAGETVLLSFNGEGLRGQSPHDGQPLWLYPWITQGERQRVNVAQPIVVSPPGNSAPNEGFVLISSGYEMGMALLRVSLEQDEWKVSEVWHSRYLRSKMSNFVVRDGYIYGFDSGILTCLDLNDGQRVWKKGRYGHGQVLLVNDLLLIQAETGEVVLVEASPDAFREVAQLDALEGKTWNNAALAGNILIVRNDREAAAFELSTRELSTSPDVAQTTPHQTRPVTQIQK